MNGTRARVTDRSMVPVTLPSLELPRSGSTGVISALASVWMEGTPCHCATI